MVKIKENNMPEVSAIIPTYNRADMVVRAVESVLSQSFADFECIVIDDGSGDDTFEKLGKISDQRLRVLRQDNKGVSAARNHGISVSRGNYLALLDSDDQWESDKLELQLEFMKNEKLEISQTEEIWIRGGKRVNQCKKHEKPEGFFFEKSLSMCMVSPSCVIFSRRFWEQVGPFDELMPACEDYDLWLRGGLNFPVGLLRKRLTVKHGGRPDQLSNSVPALDRYRMYSMVKLLRSGELGDEKEQLLLDELQRKSGYYAGGCRKRGKDSEADKIDALVRNAVAGRAVDPMEFIGN